MYIEEVENLNKNCFYSTTTSHSHI